VTIKYRFREDEFLKKAQEYLSTTYEGHYVGDKSGTEKENIQTIDVWKTLGNVHTTCRDTAIKYLMRYGKKGGYSEKDLLKAIHYIVLLAHFTLPGDPDKEMHNKLGDVPYEKLPEWPTNPSDKLKYDLETEIPDTPNEWKDEFERVSKGDIDLEDIR
jgi:hypothetical protein